MIIALVAMAALVGQDPARDVSQKVPPEMEALRVEFINGLLQYRELDTFQATIEHTDSSGLFPGEFTQSLKWRKGGRFELIVTKKSKFKPRRGEPGGLAPNYYGDGTVVVAVMPDGTRRTSPIVPDKGTSPGWEVSGGPIMSALFDTEVFRFYAKPPPNVQISFDAGRTTSWERTPVREIVVTMLNFGEVATGRMFFAVDGKEFVGQSFEMGRFRGKMVYRDQKRNEPLPETLGTPPAQ
jgi:hypothetical protein